MEKVIDALYEISNNMHSWFNGWGSFRNGYFYSKGRIFTNEEDAQNYSDPNPSPIILESYDENGNSIGGWCEPVIGDEHEMTDCRFESVDDEIKQFVYDYLCESVFDFYKKNDNDDEFLLLLGFSINLYYVVGLYATYGKFDVNRILGSISSVEIKEYGNLINEFLYSKMTKGIIDGIDNIEFINGRKEIVSILINDHEDIGIDEFYKLVQPCCKNYIPDLYMLFKENDFKRNPDDYLKEMIQQYPDYRFGWVYCCIQEGKEFYETKGEKVGVLDIKKILGNDLFWHVLGINVIDGEKVEMVDGNIKRIRSMLLSEYGFGIPKIKTIDDREIRDKISFMIEKNEDEKKIILNTDIRKKTERILGINEEVIVVGSPLKYASKLFEIIQEQKESLEEKNKILLRLNKQRRNLIDHLAHSWGNECYPEIVKKVAEELLKNGEKSLAKRLFKAYNSENDLMGQIIFLQSAMEDEPEKLKEIFVNSFFVSGKGKPKWKIQTVIEESLENLVFSLLNYTGEKKKRLICQKKLCAKYTLDVLRRDYSKKFETDKEWDGKSFVNWFSDNIFSFTIKKDECWNSINFGNTEYGRIVMKNIFSELFTNVLFHGGRMCEVILDSTDDKMYIKVKNGIVDNAEGRRKGLSSLKEVIAKLNYNTSVSEDEGLFYGIVEEDVYETVVTFAKELMYIEEW